jgi:tetratricopeptide (TPR) repeat protein
VAGAISARLTPEEEARLAKAIPVDPEVYELYLRGNYLNPFVADEGRRAVEYLRQVIERAPGFAPAQSGLARRLAWLAGLGIENPAVVLPEARAAAARACELDPGSGEALAVVAYLEFVHDLDSNGAREAFARALELEPQNVNALARRAETLDPDSLSIDFLNILGWIYAQVGRRDDAQRIVAAIMKHAREKGRTSSVG